MQYTFYNNDIKDMYRAREKKIFHVIGKQKHHLFVAYIFS